MYDVEFSSEINIFKLFLNLTLPHNKLLNDNNKNIIKCNHENNFISYCLENTEKEGGLICNDCLYKYRIDHVYKCIPIKNNNFENYKNYYKQCLNKQKIILKKLLMK